MEIFEGLPFLTADIFWTAVVTIIGTLLATRLLNRRIHLKYNVKHSQIGLSVEDAVFGQVKVTWNDNELHSIFLSAFELRNTSSRDVENLKLLVYSNENTNLLSEKSRMSESIETLRYSEEYSARVIPKTGEVASTEQNQEWFRQREYLLPLLSRGQTATIEFFTNAARDENQNVNPHISASIQHKGVKLDYTTDPVVTQKIMSVSAIHAAWVGLPIAIILTVIASATIENVNIKIFLALTFGLLTSVPGAATIFIYKRIKALIAG